MPPPNILVVRFSSIGDLLLTTPLLRAIRARHPEAGITFVVREDMADTLRHNPRISRLITWRRGSSLRELARSLSAEQWTHRLDLHGSLRSRALRLLVGGRWNGYPKHRWRRRLLIATHRKLGGRLDPVAERYFAAARALDVRPDGGSPEFFISDDAARQADSFLAAHQLGCDRALIALAPGAAHFTKRWPTRHWIALAQRLGERQDLVVVGGAGDREVADAIVDGMNGRAVSAAGAFSLEGTGALIARAAGVVAGDTGLLHLATAVGTPVTGLYGPTVEEFGFYPYRASARIVQLDLSCRPCSAQGGPRCPLGHHHCLEQLTADRVIAAMNAGDDVEGVTPRRADPRPGNG
ncbi:MAG TPA: lipopolysaccharide heptosyltransferase II [Gemmatimonadales bacterium]|jgi:lipopolysaccharide heptosyltransferase II